MAYVKSVIYLCGFGAFSYALLKIVTPDEDLLRKELAKELPDYRNETLKKRQAIVDVLRGASVDSKPMYRQTKEEIDASRDQMLSTPKKP